MPPTINRSTVTHLDVAAALRPVLEEHAAANDLQGRLHSEVVDALRDSGLFQMLVPAELGGDEAAPTAALDVIAAVAHADASTGWCLMAGMVMNGIAGSMLDGAAARAIFVESHNPICAGQVAPRGKAVKDRNGYVISGPFGFCSGGDHAGWIFGGFLEMLDGELVRDAAALPNLLGACVPVDDVEFQGNWDVLGLRGTGSYDYLVPERWVDEQFVFSLFGSTAQRGGPMYRLGVHGLTALGHAGFALGVGQRLLDEIAELSHTKKRVGKGVLVSLPTFQVAYATAEAELRAARAYVVDAFEQICAAADVDAVTTEMRANLRLATTHAVEVLARVADMAQRQAGSDGIRRGSVIERCFRDAHTATQHIFTDEKSLLDSAQVLLGVADPRRSGRS